MVLKNKWEVIEVKKKSGAEGFKDVNVGDIIEIVLDCGSYGEDCKFVKCYINSEFRGEKALKVVRHTFNNFSLKEV